MLEAQPSPDRTARSLARLSVRAIALLACGACGGAGDADVEQISATNQELVPVAYDLGFNGPLFVVDVAGSSGAFAVPQPGSVVPVTCDVKFVRFDYSFANAGYRTTPPFQNQLLKGGVVVATTMPPWAPMPSNALAFDSFGTYELPPVGASTWSVKLDAFNTVQEDAGFENNNLFSFTVQKTCP